MSLVITTHFIHENLKLKIPSIKYYPVRAPVVVEEIPAASSPIPQKILLISLRKCDNKSPALNKVISRF